MILPCHLCIMSNIKSAISELLNKHYKAFNF